MSQDSGLVNTVKSYIPGLGTEEHHKSSSSEDHESHHVSHGGNQPTGQAGGGILSYIPGFGGGSSQQGTETAEGANAPRTTRSGTVYGGTGGVKENESDSVPEYNESSQGEPGSGRAHHGLGSTAAGGTSNTAPQGHNASRAAHSGDGAGGVRVTHGSTGNPGFADGGHAAGAGYASGGSGGGGDHVGRGSGSGVRVTHGSSDGSGFAEGGHAPTAGYASGGGVGHDAGHGSGSDYGLGQGPAHGGSYGTSHGTGHGHGHTHSGGSTGGHTQLGHSNQPSQHNTSAGGAESDVKGAPIEGENIKGYAVSAPVGTGDVNERAGQGDPSGQVSGAHMEYGPIDTDSRDRIGRGTIGRTSGEGDSSFANVKRDIANGTEHVTSHQSTSRVTHSSTTQL